MVALNTMNMPFLSSVYQELDFVSGSLLSACDLPNDAQKDAWLNSGDWLTLAHKIGAEKIFFVKDEPVIVFYQMENEPSEAELKEVIRKVWCMSRPQRLFLALPTELRVYDLNRLPINQNQTLEAPLATVTQIAEVSEKLQQYSRQQLESGYLPVHEKRFGDRADKQLIQDLKQIRKELESAGLKLEHAHALISRAIFIRYLEDRGILLESYFQKVAENNPHWQSLLTQSLEKPSYQHDDREHFFYHTLNDKAFTYAVFNKLAEDFNGDLFPKGKTEEAHINQEHLDLLKGFLLGNVGVQQKLFFYLYDFSIVPIELISNIYEEFYHTTKQEDKKGTGSHYTPSVLAEFVLSEVLTHQRLATNPVVLDPACGSGIFLVEAFRRIVRFKMQQSGQLLSASDLREILQNQIRGIEINKNAVEITAFSLYLALLHYQNPKDILAQISELSPNKPLPHLIYDQQNESTPNYYDTLFLKNAFDIQLPIQPASIDIVVGNPPWGFVTKMANPDIKTSQNKALEWCNNAGWKIGDNELSQAFIARSLDFLKEGTGEAALLISTGIFLKQHQNSQLFRSKWLRQTTIKKVVNFAHVRHIFFSATSPFALVHYQNKSASFSHRVRHLSAKRLAVVKGNTSVVLYHSDIRQIRQNDLINNEQLWKTYWWGGHRDAVLLEVLKLERKLNSFADRDAEGLPITGRGFECSNGTKKSDWLSTYKELPTRHFNRYERLDTSFLINAPPVINRLGKRELYEGWRLLVKRGITEKNGVNGRVDSRLENKAFCFRNSIHGVKIDQLSDWQRKVVVAIFWSSLSRYYFFMTSGSWGMWHHEIHLVEVENFPIRFPSNNNLKQKIVSIVDQLRNRENCLLEDSERAVRELESQLDIAVFELYELNEAEQDLVLDMCEMGLEFFYKEDKSNAVKPIFQEKTQGLISELPKNRQTEKGLEGYLYAFLDFWNDELEPEGEFNWTVISPKNNPMLAVVFSTQNKGDNLPALQDKEAWDAALSRCGAALNRPISRDIYMDGMVRSVSDTEIIIIKRNECRLWTRTAAREDAEATLAQAIKLQQAQA